MATTLENKHTRLSSRVKGGGGGVDNKCLENEHSSSFSRVMGGGGGGGKVSDSLIFDESRAKGISVGKTGH